MHGNSNYCRYKALLTACALLLVAGCREDAPEQSVDSGSQVADRLAMADAVDGTVDKIVSRCGMCALGMDGRSEHSATVSEYTLHFCSEHCLESFQKDTTKNILAMKKP